MLPAHSKLPSLPGAFILRGGLVGRAAPSGYKCCCRTWDNWSTTFSLWTPSLPSALGPTPSLSCPAEGGTSQDYSPALPSHPLLSHERARHNLPPWETPKWLSGWVSSSSPGPHHLGEGTMPTPHLPPCVQRALCTLAGQLGGRWDPESRLRPLLAV